MRLAPTLAAIEPLCDAHIAGSGNLFYLELVSDHGPKIFELIWLKIVKCFQVEIDDSDEASNGYGAAS